MIRNKNFAKKRMMFIQNEDYNFLAYNVLVFLNEMGCLNEKTKFRDFRNIAYLVEFISGVDSLDLDNYTIHELKGIYLRSQLNKKLLSHLIITLQRKKYLDISLNVTHRTIELWLIKDNIPNTFFENKIFDKEVANIKYLKRKVKIRKNTSVKTLSDNIFSKRGVSTWEI